MDTANSKNAAHQHHLCEEHFQAVREAFALGTWKQPVEAFVTKPRRFCTYCAAGYTSLHDAVVTVLCSLDCDTGVAGPSSEVHVAFLTTRINL